MRSWGFSGLGFRGCVSRRLCDKNNRNEKPVATCHDVILLLSPGDKHGLSHMKNQLYMNSLKFDKVFGQKAFPKGSLPFPMQDYVQECVLGGGGGGAQGAGGTLKTYAGNMLQNSCKKTTLE